VYVFNWQVEVAWLMVKRQLLLPTAFHCVLHPLAGAAAAATAAKGSAAAGSCQQSQLLAADQGSRLGISAQAAAGGWRCCQADQPFQVC
jgi:hypothetical protein